VDGWTLFLVELKGEEATISSKQSADTQLKGNINVEDGTQVSHVPLSAESALILHFYEEDGDNVTTSSNFNECIHDSLKELRDNI
jgi:hypothetical protein